jgi:predicted ATPase
MSDVRPADASQSPFASAVARFEQAWQSGAAPSVETFLSAAGPLGAAASQDAELARELVLIDLEYRWRKPGLSSAAAASGSLPPQPRSEDYLRLFPQLYAEPAPVAELVAEEYLVRHRWGDRPSLSELVERFPGRADVVRAAEQALRSFADEQSQRERGARDTALHRSEVVLAADDPQAGASTMPPGTPWGRYVVAQLLGSGRFGSVYRCYDPHLNRFVALKVVREVPHGGDKREAVLREARAAASIRHPHVVAVFDVIENERGEIGIVTEYVAGEALEQHLGRGEPELAEAIRWTAAIAEAIHEAHTAGVVHRDLKPANILIDAAGRPRVTDFGLALVLAERGAAAGEIAGTPRFMSPEQLRGEMKTFDGRSDIWSLGVILYRLLTGRFPFAETDPTKLFQAIERDVPMPPQQWNDRLAPQLAEICLRCLAKDPRERWPTALELARALQAFQRIVDVPAPAASGERAVGKLPRPPAELIGRADELARLEQALTSPDAWLVTLCGPGGVGKTRLALEASRRIKAPPGGVWWVDWSSAAGGVAAAQAVLAALGSRPPEGVSPEEHVAHVLGCLPPLVLVLDNAEQIADAAAELLKAWSRDAPHVRYLVTSRQRLHLPGERLIELAPLGVPELDDDPATSESVQLFVRRASETEPDLKWDAAQLARAGAICRTLEGLPLALELAARRTNVLSLAEIADALRDRLVAFRASPHESSDRRRSLLAAVAWSFDLLTPLERLTLAHLSRFTGGFTRRTAATMLATLPELDADRLVDILQSLREKSLLRVRDVLYGRRFSMLEMIRQYAERIRPSLSDPESEAMLDERWASALTDELAVLRPQLTTSNAAVVLERYADEADNLALVERWALRADRPEAAVRALLPLVDALPLRGAAPDLAARLQTAIDLTLAASRDGEDHRAVAIEGRLALARLLRYEARWREALEAAREVVEDTGELDAQSKSEALRLVAEMQRRLGTPLDAEATLRRAEESAAGAGPVEQALCQVEWSVLLAQRGALPQARTRLDKAAALLADGIAPPLEAEVERRRGQLLLQAGDPRRALTRLERAESAARTAGDLRSLQSTLATRGTVSLDLGRYDAALADFVEAERLARRLGDRRGLAVVWGNRAIALADLGDHPAALESFRRAEQLNRALDAKFGIAANLAGQANVLALDGDFAAAAAAFAEALGIAEGASFEFLAAVIQGDRGVAKFLAGEHEGARADLARAIGRLESVGSPTTHEVFCYAAFAAAAERALGNLEAADTFAALARRLFDSGVVRVEDPKPRVQHALQLLNL